MTASGEAMKKDDFYRDARTDLTGPLHGVTVVETTTTWAGPMAACVLADLGARVIKVEMPGGEVARSLPPFIPESPLTIANETVNRNKESLTLDLHQQQAKNILFQLIEEAEGKAQQEATDLARSLQKQIVQGELEIETKGPNIIIRIREKGAFKSGSAELAESYYDVIDEIREVLRDTDGKISVEGHTDNLPIRTARFRSNFELSSSRAVSVAMELMRGDVLNRQRFEVTGFADTRPLTTNESEVGRARNRRVEIVVRQSIVDGLSEEDKQLLKDEGSDILRELDLDPEYIFELRPDEIF